MIGPVAIGSFYLGVSLILLIYGLISFKRSIYCLLYSIALNVFPLIPFGYLNNEIMRFLRIPFAYFPFIAASMACIISARGRLMKKDKRIFELYLYLIIYLLLQSLLIVKVQHLVSFIQYYAMWVFNIFVMLCISSIISRLPRDIALSILRSLVWLVSICALIGLGKYALEITHDANFMPMMNRNGTVFWLVIGAVLAIALHDLKQIRLSALIFLLTTYVLCLFVMQSRMGFLGFWFALACYYLLRFRFSLIRLIKPVVGAIALMLLMFAMMFVVPEASRLLSGFQTATERITMLARREEIDSISYDYTRIMLLRYAISICRHNYIFGTGVGLENYREKLWEVAPSAIRASKPHNFYLSYLAEFGVIGFSILIALLYFVWKGYGYINKNESSHNILKFCFRTLFLSVMFMCIMNEYITYTPIWMIWGIGLGLFHNQQKPNTRERSITY